MNVKTDLKKAWQAISHPERFFEEEKEISGYWPVLRFFLIINLVLAILTPIVNWLHFPSDLVHAGTNAQMGAFVLAPTLEAMTGISRFFWAGLLTYVLNVAKFPVLGLIYHVIAKGLRGKGSLLDSFKVGVYAVAPTLLFGWIPYFGLISGLWAGYLYVIALNRLHEVPLGPAIAVINFFIGIQVVWAIAFGWFGSSVPW